MEVKNIKVPVECYTRVVGYMRPIAQWNLGKQEEFQDRKTYNVNEKLNEMFANA